VVEVLRYEPEGRGFDCHSGVIGIFHRHNPSGGTMALGSTQSQYFLGGKGGRCVGLTTLPPSSAGFLEIREP
jgi:hypothetical protein